MTYRGHVQDGVVLLEGGAKLPEGAKVEIALVNRSTGEGFLRSAGGLADDPYWDEIMAEIQESRKTDRRSPVEGA